MGTNPQKQIALSLKARGLTVTPAIPRTRQLLLPSLGQSVVDISIAICVQIVLLSWSAWISVLLVILCVVFYANYQDGGMAASEGSIMIPIALLVYLPCLGLVYMTSNRRLEAQRHLEQVQSRVVGVYALHASLGSCGALHLLAQLDDAISDTMLQLQGYLSHPRTISSHHFGAGLLTGEVLPANSRLLALGADMGQRLRQVHSCMRRLMDSAAALLAYCSDTEAGRPYVQQALALVQLLVPLTASLQALLSAKDLRSPLLLRVMLRPAVVLVAPLLSGSFLAGWGLIGRPVTAAGQVFAIVVGCILQIMLMSLYTLCLLCWPVWHRVLLLLPPPQLQIMLMSLYTLSIMLEDPFDTGAQAAPDTLSMTEFMHTLAYLTAPDPSGPVSTADDSEVTVAVKPSPLGAQQEGQDTTPQQEQQWQAAPFPSRATLLTTGPDSMFQLSPEGSAASIGNNVTAQGAGVQEGRAARD